MPRFFSPFPIQRHRTLYLAPYCIGQRLHIVLDHDLSPVAPAHPNQRYRRHPHTMGNDACAWFGVNPSTSRVVGSVLEGKNMLQYDHTDTDNVCWLP